MKRKVIEELILWKTQNSGKPILLTGVKGVGKTYLAYDFAKAFFERISYINFEREPKTAEKIFESNFAQLEEYFITRDQLNLENPIEGRVLILDEISFCRDFFSALQKLKTTKLFRYIITISSIPVSDTVTNEIQKLCVFPLDFDEFLRATSNEWYIETIITHYHMNKKIPDIVHKELLAHFELYLKIGGMPSMINEYLNLSSPVNVPELHHALLGSYHDDIYRRNIDSDALKMNQVLDSVPFQLMKDNKKFQYKLIRKGTTHTMFKDAIHKLCLSSYIIKCDKVNFEQLLLPFESNCTEALSNEENNTYFKLYMSDTGVLYTKIIEEQGTILNAGYKKALLENYIAGSMKAKSYPFGFWESDSMAKVDFICSIENNIYPIEIFVDENTRSKSISILKQTCEFPYSIKISSRNFDYNNQIKYVPYYAAFCL